MIVGTGTKVWGPHLSTLLEFSAGDDCTIHSHVWIGNGVTIGDRVRIQAFSFIPEGVTIDDDVFIGPRVTFTNDKRPPSKKEDWAFTLVKRGASIGAGAIILPGVTIGIGAKIGAGAVVTKDVPDSETWVGNPARKLERQGAAS